MVQQLSELEVLSGGSNQQKKSGGAQPPPPPLRILEQKPPERDRVKIGGCCTKICLHRTEANADQENGS